MPISKGPTTTNPAVAFTASGVGTALFPRPLLVIMVTAFAVVVPFFFLGIPSGHDFEFHVNSWMEVQSQWRQGIIYPRWAALAHYAYGEARFLFYPPVSWTLGAALGAFLPWVAVPGVYVWLALTLAGCSMFLLARRYLDYSSSVFAAALYAANPYYIVIVYWRSAFAELLAGALLPLLLLYVLRLEKDGRRAVIPLGLVVAAAWLTNAPSAVMVNYSLALLLAVLATSQRSPRILLHGSVAVVLGATLAAFYILPAYYEQKWVDIAQVLSPGVRPQDNFLFTTIQDVDHNRFNLLVSLVALAEIVALAGTVFLSLRKPGRHSQLWRTLIAWAATATLFMFSFTFLLWQHLPELRFVQLPWRWLLCYNAAFALLVTIAWRRWLARMMLCAVLLAVILFAWFRVQPPWWDSAADITEMQDNIQEGMGYEGTDEYVPAGADSYEIQRDARRVVFEGPGTARIHVLRWDPEAKLFTASVSQSGNLVLRLFNYPAWKVEVNGHAVGATTTAVTGQIAIAVEPGDNRVSVTFARTWDRTIGGMVSGAAWFLVLGILLKRGH